MTNKIALIPPSTAKALSSSPAFKRAVARMHESMAKVKVMSDDIDFPNMTPQKWLEEGYEQKIAVMALELDIVKDRIDFVIKVASNYTSSSYPWGVSTNNMGKAFRDLKEMYTLQQTNLKKMYRAIQQEKAAQVQS
jgi:hypothetical protein